MLSPSLQVYTEAVKALRKAGKSKAEIRGLANAALAHKTTLFNPLRAVAAGVPMTRLVQRAGDIVVTFPRGYHGGFSAGANLGEAANFGLREWAEFGMDGALRALRIRATPVRPPRSLPPRHAVARDASGLVREGAREG